MEYGADVIDGQIKFVDARRRKTFDAEQKRWNNYTTWRAERNESRAQLEEDYGFDTKHAVHLIRLLRMGEEILTRGEVLVARPDAEDLMSLRTGGWTIEQVMDEARRHLKALPDLVSASRLPERPKRAQINELVIELHRAGFERFRG